MAREEAATLTEDAGLLTGILHADAGTDRCKVVGMEATEVTLPIVTGKLL